MFTERIARGLTRNRAETDPWADDPRLVGRTYAIPFAAVWTASMGLVEERGRWRLLQSNDLEGFIRVRCTTLVFGFEGDLEIRIGLDEHALTRVDVRSRSRKGHADLGLNTRRVGRFFRNLDQVLSAGNGKILDPRETARLTRQA